MHTPLCCRGARCGWSAGNGAQAGGRRMSQHARHTFLPLGRSACRPAQDGLLCVSGRPCPARAAATVPPPAPHLHPGAVPTDPPAWLPFWRRAAPCRGGTRLQGRQMGSWEGAAMRESRARQPAARTTSVHTTRRLQRPLKNPPRTQRTYAVGGGRHGHLAGRLRPGDSCPRQVGAHCSRVDAGAKAVVCARAAAVCAQEARRTCRANVNNYPGG